MTATLEEAPVTRSRVEWATVPRVNLLPTEILEQRRFRRTQILLASALGITALIAVLATVWAQHQVGAANKELAMVQTRTAALQAEERQYAEVPQVLAKVDAAKAARERAMASDVLWYRFLDELAVATPTTVWLGTLQVAVAPAPNAAPLDSLTPSGYGQVTVTGTSLNYSDVAQWLTQATGVHGMAVSRLTSAHLVEGTPKKDKISFAATVTVTADALSHRYDRKAG